MIIELIGASKELLEDIKKTYPKGRYIYDPNNNKVIIRCENVTIYPEHKDIHIISRTDHSFIILQVNLSECEHIHRKTFKRRFLQC